jgi:hypothetical protein
MCCINNSGRTRSANPIELPVRGGKIPVVGAALVAVVAGRMSSMKSSRHSGNSIDCPRAAPSMKRFIPAPQIARSLIADRAFSRSQGHSRRRCLASSGIRAASFLGRAAAARGDVLRPGRLDGAVGPPRSGGSARGDRRLSPLRRRHGRPLSPSARRSLAAAYGSLSAILRAQLSHLRTRSPLYDRQLSHFAVGDRQRANLPCLGAHRGDERRTRQSRSVTALDRGSSCPMQGH